ncbi:MAG TPA: type 1 glutamine amidotransferase domain-containing protein [Mycobacterium sp.]|nr:type 1 glutamine amidotransferase domain-containing protein [Mycobacterium sp.]
MSNELQGQRIAFLVANSGVEQVELTTPWQAVEEAGGQPILIAPTKDTVQAVNHDTEIADTFSPSHAVADVDSADFAALVLPGGVANPDKLRLVPEAVAFVKSFAEAGKPIAAICHGPWSLVEADIVKGKTLTSWPSLQTDIRNAGGQWHDEEVVTCRMEGFTLVTSRKPDDLDGFTTALVDAFSTSG